MQKKNKKTIAILATALALGGSAAAATLYTIIVSKTKQKEYDSRLKKLEDDKRDVLYDDDDLTREIEKFLDNPLRRRYQPDNLKDLEDLETQIQQHHQRDIQNLSAEVENSIISSSVKSSLASRVKNLENKAQKSAFKRELDNIKKLDKEVSSELSHITKPSDKARFEKRFQNESRNSTDLDRLKGDILIYIANEADSARRRQQAIDKLNAQLIQRVNNNSNYNQDSKKYWIDSIKDLTTKKDLEKLQLLKNKLDTNDNTFRLNDGQVKNELLQKTKDATKQAELDSINAQSDKILNDKRDNILSAINKLLIEDTKSKFNADLEQSNNEKDLDNLASDVKKAQIIEESSQNYNSIKNANYLELNNLITHVEDINRLQELNNDIGRSEYLGKSRSKHKDIVDVHDKIIGELNKQSPKDTIAYEKAALKDKINNFSVHLSNKDELLALVDTMTAQNSTEVINKINEALVFEVLKHEAPKAVENLDVSNELHDKLKSRLAQPNLNIFDYDEIIKEAIKPLNALRSEIRKGLEILDDFEQKNTLSTKLKTATKESELIDIKKQVDSLNQIREDIRDNARKLVERLSESDQKEVFKKLIQIPAVRISELENIISTAQRTLHNEQQKAKTNAQKANDHQRYNELNKQANTDTLTQDQYKAISDEANRLFETQKNSTSQLIADSKLDDTIKDQLVSQTELASNIKELKVIEAKLKALEKVSKITDPGIRGDLQNKILDIELDDADAHKKITEAISDADKQLAKENTNIVENAKRQIKSLPYPSGENSEAIKEMLTEIDNIQKDQSLSPHQKTQKITKLINQIGTLNSKIQEAKKEIEKLSTDRQKELNNLLDKTNLLPEGSNEFETLFQKIKDAKANDKNDFVNKINSLSHLTKQQRDEFINKINQLETDNYDKLNKIYADAQLRDKLNDFIDTHVKKLDYPAHQNAQAIQDIIAEVEKIDSEEQLENFKARGGVFETIKSNIKLVKDKLSSLHATPQDVIDAFNNANTNEEFAELIKLIDSKVANENKKELLDHKVEQLPYPNADGSIVGRGKNTAKAIEEIKKLYVDANGVPNPQKMTEVEGKLNQIKQKINTSIQEINKISKESQKPLWEKLRETHDEAGFDALTKQIKEAHLADINKALAEVNKLNHLEETVRDKFKTEVGAADSSDKIDEIVDKARVENYRQEIKNLINLSEYVKDNVSDQTITDKFNATKQKISDQIDKVVTNTDTHLQKLHEIQEFIKELNKVRDEIAGLTSSDVLDPTTTKTELNKLIVDVSDTKGLEKIKLEIEKRRQIKHVTEAGYDKDAEAIKSLKQQINNATSLESLKPLSEFIKKLPEKIKEAREKINEISDNDKVKNAQKRKESLLSELNRADTEAKFEQLKNNIEKAKSQNADEYKNSVKERVINQAKSLKYPKSNQQQESVAVTAIIAEIEKDFKDKTTDSDVEQTEKTWNTKLNQISSKVTQVNQLLTKVDPSKLDNLNIEFNLATDTSKLDTFIQKLNDEIKKETEEVKTKIDALKHLKNKNSFIDALNNTTHQQRLDKLKEAYRADLEARIDALKYHSSTAAAKATLKHQLPQSIDEAQHKQELSKLDELDNALQEATNKISQLPYKTQKPAGREHLYNTLDTLTEKSKVEALVPDKLKQQLESYFGLISRQPNAIEDSQQRVLNAEYEKVATQEQLDQLKLSIYNSKRNKAHMLIDALKNLDTKDKETQKAKIAAKTKHTDITDLSNEFTSIDKIILESQKLDAKAAIDKLPYPLEKSKSEAARNKLKTDVDNSRDLEHINAVLEKVKQLNSSITSYNNKVNSIKLDKYKAKVNEEIVKVHEPSGFATVELELERAKTADKINGIKGLKDTKINELLTELDQKSNKNDFKGVYNKALLEFKKQEYIDKTIKSISYIKNSKVYEQSIDKLIKEVEAIDTTPNLDAKKQQIDTFIQKLAQKVSKFNEIFNKYHLYTHAKSKIADAIDASTTVDELDKALPDNWLSQIDEATGVINLYFGPNTLTDELQKTYPSATEGNPTNGLTLKELQTKIIDKMVEEANKKIDSLIASDTKKAEIKARISSIRTNNISPNAINLTQALKQIYDETIKAQKDDLTSFIDNIGYPQSSQNTAITQLKNKYVQGFSEETKFNQNEKISSSYRDLKEIKEHVSAANTEIAKITSQSQKNQLNGRLILKTKITEIDQIKEDAKVIKTIEDELNKITHLSITPSIETDSSADDINKVNESIDALKDRVRERIDTLVSSSQNDVEAFKSYLDQLINKLNELKGLFTTDTIVMKRYVDKLTNTNNATELSPILDEAKKFDGLFKTWWTKDKNTYNGRYIKENKTLLSNNSTADASKKVVDGVKFKTYENLLKELRESEDIRKVERIVTGDYALYHGLIDFLKASNPLKGLPNATHEYYRDEVLKAQTKERIEQLKSEIVNTATVVTGIKGKLNGLQSGNNAALLRDVEGIKNYNEAITIERKVNDFIKEFNNTKDKLEQYKKSTFKNNDKARAFEAELLRVDEKQEAIALGKKIDAELVKISKKDAISKLSSISQEQKQHWYTMIDNEQNASKLDGIVDKAKQFNDKVKEAKDTLASIGATTNRTQLTNEIDNSRTIEQIDPIVNKVKAFKTAYTNAAKYVDEYAKFKDKDTAKANEFTQRKGTIQTTEQATQLLNEVKAKFVDQIKDVVKQIKYPDNNSQDAINSRSTLEHSVENVSNAEGYIPLYEKVSTIKNLLDKRIEEIDANKLPYEENAKALADIKRELNKATTPERIRQVYPEDWAQTVQKYRNALNKYLPKNNETQNLWNRFNLTWNGNSVETPAGMQEQLYATLKRDAKKALNSLSNLSNKNDFSTRIDQVTNNANIDENLNKIVQIYFEAFQQNYNTFIDQIQYPEGKDSSHTKQTLKAKVSQYSSHKAIVYEGNNKTNLETELNQINSLVGEIKSKITALNLTKKTAEWTTELSKADSKDKLERLLAKLVPYEKVKLLIDNIVPLAQGFIGENNSDQDVNEVNESYTKLRETFQDKLDKATDSNVQALGALADEVRKSIDQFKPAFRGDVLAQKHFVEELNNATTAQQAADIKDKAINYSTKLNEFWNGHDRSGSYIKDHKDKLNNAQQFGFKTYDELLREVRTFGDITKLSKFITEKVPLYHGFIDYRLATDNKLSGKAKDHYDNQITSKKSKQELLSLRDEAIKYINKHKEAKDKIDRISNQEHRNKFNELLNDTETVADVEKLIHAINDYNQHHTELSDLINNNYSGSFNKLRTEDKNKLKLNNSQKPGKLITEFTPDQFKKALNSKEGLVRTSVLLLQAKIVSLLSNLDNNKKAEYITKLHQAGENEAELGKLLVEMRSQIFDKRRNEIIEKAKQRLEKQIIINDGAFTNPKYAPYKSKVPTRHNNYADKLYLEEMEKELKNAQTPEQMNQIERKFLFERYAESRRLSAVLNTLEWYLKNYFYNTHKNDKYTDALQALINAFRDKNELKGYVISIGETKYNESGYVYSDSKLGRTTSMFGHLWDKIASQDKQWQEAHIVAFQAATQWTSRLKVPRSEPHWDWYDNNNQNSVMDIVIKRLKDDKNVSVDEIYSVIDEFSCVSLDIFTFDAQYANDNIPSLLTRQTDKPIAAIFEMLITNAYFKSSKYLKAEFGKNRNLFGYDLKRDQDTKKIRKFKWNGYGMQIFS